MRKFLTIFLVSMLTFTSAIAQSDSQKRSVPTTVSLQERDPVGIAEIAAMPANTWLHYGRPWRDIDPGRDNNCGVDFGSVLGAWNGVLWDDRYVWSWAAGGHGDGCFNGIIRYDLATGTPEMIAPHVPLNVPLCRTFKKRDGTLDCWNEPYVSKMPWPAGMNLSKDEKLANGPTIPRNEFLDVKNRFGAFLRPRASHMYNNLVRIGDYVYLLTGQIYGSSKGDAQVWRFSVNDPENSIERLPDRWDPEARGGKGDQFGGVGVNWIQRPGQSSLMISGSDVCDPDLVSGQYNCERRNGFYFSGSATLAWDRGRQGFWGIDSNFSRLAFVRNVDGAWVMDDSLSVVNASLLDKKRIGNAGICLVPTPAGANPIIWGDSAELIRWNGKKLQIIKPSNGLGAARRNILNKWTWRNDLHACLGTWSVDEAFWVYKPDFADREPDRTESADRNAAADKSEIEAEGIPTDVSAGELDQTQPTAPLGLPPAPVLNPLRDDNPLAAGTALQPRTATQPQSLQKGKPADEEIRKTKPDTDNDSKSKAENGDRVRLPAEWPVFAGHVVEPEPWTPAAWNQPIERLPEAPDYNAECPGAWAELDYRTQEDAAGSAIQMRGLVRGGTPNVRIYLHPMLDASGGVIPYNSRIKFDEVACAEIVGVPVDGKKPEMTESIVPGRVGIVARGIVLDGSYVAYTGNTSQKRGLKWMVLHDMEMYGAGPLWGTANKEIPLVYIELRGSVFGANTDWHLFYLERTVGKLVALSSVFYGSGRGYHTLKNLAHQSRLEGNVFSNVGIDGQPLGVTKRGDPVVGLFSLDLYGCTETVLRNNTIVFRTDNFVRALVSYRGRAAWGNCDKGERQEGGTWPEWAPESPAYDDPAKWAEIAAALPAFDQGYEAAKAEPWLFTHLVEDNTFIVFNAHGGKDDTRFISMESLRPIADNTVKAAIKSRSRALAQRCVDAADRTACFLAGADDKLLYAYNHFSSSLQNLMVESGNTPSAIPIQHPKDWQDRVGVFLGENQFVTCDADGEACRETGERGLRADPKPGDELEALHPPRIIHQ